MSPNGDVVVELGIRAFLGGVMFPAPVAPGPPNPWLHSCGALPANGDAPPVEIGGKPFCSPVTTPNPAPVRLRVTTWAGKTNMSGH